MSGKGAHEGRPYVRLGGGRGWVREDNEGKGNKIPRLRFAALGMTCGAAGDGFLPPSSRGQALRGNDGGRESEGGRAKDGSPHPRGQWEGCGDGEGVNVREGGPRGTPLREVGWGTRMGSRPRLHEGGTRGMVREDNEEGEGVNVREGGPRGTLLREVGWGTRMGSCLRLHGGRLYAGMTEGVRG